MAGETFVLDDGGETDLDLGNYERFLDISLGILGGGAWAVVCGATGWGSRGPWGNVCGGRRRRWWRRWW